MSERRLIVRGRPAWRRRVPSCDLLIILVLPGRIELTTSPLPRGCSTTELRQQKSGAVRRVAPEAGGNCHKGSQGARIVRPLYGPARNRLRMRAGVRARAVSALASGSAAALLRARPVRYRHARTKGRYDTDRGAPAGGDAPDWRWPQRAAVGGAAGPATIGSRWALEPLKCGVKPTVVARYADLASLRTNVCRAECGLRKAKKRSPCGHTREMIECPLGVGRILENPHAADYPAGNFVIVHTCRSGQCRKEGSTRRWQRRLR